MCFQHQLVANDLFSREPLADAAGRIAGHYAVRFHITTNDSTGGHDCTAANSYPSDDDGTKSHPDIVANDDLQFTPRTTVLSIANPRCVPQWASNSRKIMIVAAYEPDSVAYRHPTSYSAVAHNRAVAADVGIGTYGKAMRSPQS